MIQKPLPNSEESEKALLCSIRLSPDILGEFPRQFGSDQFSGPANRKLFSLFVSIAEKRRQIDFFEIKEALSVEGALEEVGDIAGLNDIWTFVPSAANWKYYLERIWESWLRRRVMIAADRLIDQLADPALEDVVGAVQQFAETELMAIAKGVQEEYRPFRAWVLETIDEMDADVTKRGNSLIGFGLGRLDSALGGLSAGDLAVVCAETSFGKSSLALQAVRASSAKGIGSVIFSFEMAPRVLVQRILAAESDLSMRSLRMGLLTEKEYPKLTATVQKIADYPIWLTDSSRLNIGGIVSAARWLKTARHIGLVVVDYLQLVPGISHGKDYSREREVANISRQLKKLADELQVAVIACSQLNDEGRLRESRAIGQDADIILKIEDPESSQDAFLREITILKQRHGPKDQKIPVNFFGQYMKFENFN